MKPTAFLFLCTILVFIIWLVIKVGIFALLVVLISVTILSFVVEVAVQVARNLKNDQDGK